jgi:hypothetical protein
VTDVADVMHRAMQFAYADPPYLGQCKLYGHNHPEGDRPFDGRCWDDPETHRLLIERLTAEFPDGWALSASSPSMQTLMPWLPEGHRTAAWVKSFSAFKKGVRPAYAWEPVFLIGGRNPNAGWPHPPPPKDGKQTTPKDFYVTEHDEWQVIVCPITLKKGLTGAKPEAFCSWVLDLLNVQAGDYVTDVFSGTGVMGRIAAERTEAAA